MEYRVLGRTGVNVSPLCLGTDNFADPTPEKEASQILNTALDRGINFIDTSNVYGGGVGNSEEILGSALTARGGRAFLPVICRRGKCARL